MQLLHNAAKTINVTKGGKVVPFQTKLAQAAAMIIEIASCFADAPVRRCWW